MAHPDEQASEAPSDFRGRILDGRIRLAGWREVEAAWIRFDALWLDGRRPASVWLLDPDGDNAHEMATRLCGQELCVGLPDHPSILTTLASGWTEDGFHWLATERPPARTLPAQPGPIGLPLLAKWGRRLLEALVFLEKHRIVHGGIRPEAILLEARTDEIVLAGFGASTQRLDLGRTPVRAIDEAWVSPEQLAGEPVDTRADQFSAGLLLYVLATGERPEIARRDLLSGAPSSRVPPMMAELVTRMVAEAPSARFSSARRVRAEFELAASESDVDDDDEDADGGGDVITQRWRRVGNGLSAA